MPVNRFRISNEPIVAAACGSALSSDSAGAFVTFEGWVRDHSEGGSVISLEYEAYITLAEKEGDRILAEAAARFPILAASGIHRVGPLDLGDLAVWVGVVAEHRAAAFDACRYIIDETKARLPVWKREHYRDGVSVWIDATARG
ncbi:MAG: molybdenum cofactor biosynthesis protein MoaE [Opitutaceae bacterium]